MCARVHSNIPVRNSGAWAVCGSGRNSGVGVRGGCSSGPVGESGSGSLCRHGGMSLCRHDNAGGNGTELPENDFPEVCGELAEGDVAEELLYIRRFVFSQASESSNVHRCAHRRVCALCIHPLRWHWGIDERGYQDTQGRHLITHVCTHICAHVWTHIDTYACTGVCTHSCRG